MGIGRRARRRDLHNSEDGRNRPRRRSRRVGRRVLVGLLVLVILAAGGGFAAYDAGYLDRFLCAGGECTAQDVLPPEELDLPRARPARPVLEPASGSAVSAAKVRAAVRPLLNDKALGKHVGFAVADLTHDRRVWGRGQGTFVPASTLKLFTSLAALHRIGPGERFSTTVTRHGNRIVLVGGGDPYLASKPPKPGEHPYPRPATIVELADRTATALAKAGISSVRLGFDDSLFTGPAVNPRWESDYVPSVTTPVSALWVDQGVSAKTGVRSTTPAQDAAKRFAHALRQRGLTVRGKLTRQVEHSDDVIAAVRSAPLEQITQSLITHSDNQAAEVVLRHLAIAAGEPASFAGGVRAMRQTLTQMGVPWGQNRIFDGSGLSRQNRVTLTSELAVLREAAESSAAAGMLDDLPVAGFEGSLQDRFVTAGTGAGLGLVRAKTGTLTGVHGLSGTTVTADGAVLAFVVLADKVKPANTLEARATLAKIASALTACSCGR